MKIYEIITETAWARRAAEIPTGREDEFDEPIYGDFDVGEYDTEEPLETELGDDAEGILLDAVKELIKDEASEIETDFLKNKVMDQTGEPFKTSDLIALFNRSETLQHYIEKIDANKVKFNTDMLTATTDKSTGDSGRDQKAATLKSMAARAASRRV